MAATQRCPRCKAQVPAGARFCQTCGGAMPESEGGARGQRSAAGAASQWKLFAVGVLVIAMLAAGAVALIPRMFAHSRAPDSAHAVSMEAMAERAGPVPVWLAAADIRVQEEYMWASAHREELQYIPCYCGCYDFAGHVDNWTCYFRPGPEGTVAGYDNHAHG